MHLGLGRAALASALLLLPALAGCVGVRNMGELKETLGAVEPEESLPALPPMAKAMAFPTVVKVGEPVLFTSAGSSDPEGRKLVSLWNFNDGTRGTGGEVRHAFARPGDYRVELTVSDPDGLWDVAALDIKVLPTNLPPLAEIRALDARGTEATRTTPGSPLTFKAVASDPEGAPLDLAWDFGDGDVATEPETKHAWNVPGRWLVTLRATDAGGAVNRSTVEVAVDLAMTKTGTLTPSDAATSFAFPGGPAEALVATVAYDASFGANDVVLRVLDAAGTELARTTATPTAAAQGAFDETLELDAALLSAAAPGEWTLVVERVSGVRVPFTATIDLTY